MANIDFAHVPDNRGAYGFCLICPQVDEPLRDLTECGPDAPEVALEWRLATTSVDHEYVGDRRVAFGVRGASSVFVERDPPSILFDLADPPVPDALLHPLGTIPLAILARWRGDITLHAGGFAAAGGAWAVLGEREAGKSTMLATLVRRGLSLVSDDLLTVLDGHVWPGPGCVDLRPDVAARFPGARDLGMVAGRRRFRLSSPPTSERLPLKGIFVLGWHEEPGVAVEPLTVEQRLELLYEFEYVALVGAADPTKLLELLDVPAWRITRRREWDATDEAVDAILEIARAQD
jgi:hypothetical protein